MKKGSCLYLEVQCVFLRFPGEELWDFVGYYSRDFSDDAIGFVHGVEISIPIFSYAKICSGFPDYFFHIGMFPLVKNTKLLDGNGLWFF